MSSENKEIIVESNKFTFSVVMAVYNVEKYLNEAIDSIINQSLDFKKHIQLILVNDGSRDNSLKIALDYQKEYPDNIIVIDKENGGVASARNIGLENANGKYINFMDSDDKISLNAFEEVYNFFKKHDSTDYDMVSIPVFFFDSREGAHYLNYKFEEAEEDVVDLNKNPDFYQLYSHSVFIKKEAISNEVFFKSLISGSCNILKITLFILEASKDQFDVPKKAIFEVVLSSLLNKFCSKSSLISKSKFISNSEWITFNGLFLFISAKPISSKQTITIVSLLFFW